MSKTWSILTIVLQRFAKSVFGAIFASIFILCKKVDAPLLMGHLLLVYITLVGVLS